MILLIKNIKKSKEHKEVTKEDYEEVEEVYHDTTTFLSANEVGEGIREGGKIRPI